MISNICRANFNGGRTAQGNNRYQWDYGQILEISGIENLPDPFTAQFSNYPVLGTAKTAVGTGGSVEIPNEYFVSGQNIYCFIVLHTDEDDGRTVYVATIPVTKRPQPIDDPITPTQQSTIDTAIAALQAGVARAEGYAEAAEEQAGIAQSAATTATEAATRAEGAVADVEAAATRAEQAADGAEASATAAEASATGAETAKTAAEAAKSAAETAAASAEQSATDAGNYAGLAEEAETAAAASATAAEASATAAAASATQASGSATQAAQSASEASESATAAQTSATNADAAKTGAETAQTAAETAQGKAEQAQASAEQSATTAEWYAERVERFLPTDTASGEIASFPDGADGVPMQSVVVSMEPIQDLHGQANPYPAGGGKNLFSGFVKGYNIADSTGEEKADSTSAASGYIDLPETFATASYYLSGITDRLYNVVYFYDASHNYIGRTGGAARTSLLLQTSTIVGSLTGIEPSTCKSVRVTQYQNPNVPGIVDEIDSLKTQIEKGTTPTAYAPYSNICPISGRTGAEVTRCGKNLFDLRMFAEEYPDYCTYDESTGELTVSSNGALYNTGVSVNIPLDASNGGYLQYDAKNGADTSNFRFRIFYEDGTLFEPTGTGSQTDFVHAAYSLDSKKIVSVRMNWTKGGTFTIKNFCITQGTTATAYEPYQGDTISVSWESEAGTVYGGTLDVVGGELVVDRKLIIPRTVIAASASPIANWIFGISDNPSLSDNSGKIVSNYFAKGGLAPGKCYITNTGKYIVCAPVDDTLNTYALANAWLAEHDLQFCYELATPITYHLTPQEVRTLLGANNVWSDARDVAVTYKADVQLYIDKRISAVS